MHWLALAEGVDHVCCRYRLRAFQPLLADNGVSLDIRAIPRNLFARFALFRSARHYDGVILLRKLLSKLDLVWLRWFSRKLLFDFDDAVWLRDSYSGKGFESAKRSRRFQRIAKAADAVVCGNRFLAEEVAKFNKAVQVIPTCVDPLLYPTQAQHTRIGSAAHLVWLGSSSTLQGLEQNRAILEALGKALPGLTLRVICDRFPKFDHLRVVPIPWSEATEAVELAACDIGIGYVPDDPWSRGKCGLKLLQYHAAGLAVVANPVGVQADIVTSGVTGELATTIKEWVHAVATLANEPQLRQQYGSAGRAHLEQQYSVAHGAGLWKQVLCEQLLQ
jgi:glycosyltransferase involved in cell wall biosynthesis